MDIAYNWYCFYVPSNNIAWAADYTSAQQQASQTGKPIILFFTGKWCVPCRIMKRTVWANEQVTASVNASFIPVTIDVDDSDATAALSRYSVGATPKTIITDSQGNVLQQVEGGMGKTDFLEMLRKLNPITAGDAPLLLCSSIGGAMSPLVWRMYRSVRGYPAGPTKEGGSEQPQ